MITHAIPIRLSQPTIADLFCAEVRARTASLQDEVDCSASMAAWCDIWLPRLSGDQILQRVFESPAVRARWSTAEAWAILYAEHELRLRIATPNRHRAIRDAVEAGAAEARRLRLPWPKDIVGVLKGEPSD